MLSPSGISSQLRAQKTLSNPFSRCSIVNAPYHLRGVSSAAKRRLTSLQHGGSLNTRVSGSFDVLPTSYSDRIKFVRFPDETVSKFLEATSMWPVQALEYKPFLRYQVGKVLEDICGGNLRSFLLETMLDRNKGAMVVRPKMLSDISQADNMVKFSTAISHLMGGCNFDAMSQKYYARFVVENVDSSDSYLRQAHRVMELHNDGTFVDEATDFVLMMKIDEQHMKGGNSLILHLDDWKDLDKFSNSKLAKKSFRWTAPASKNTNKDVFHPIFGEDKLGRPTMSYIDQFVQPENLEEGTWLFQLGESLEGSDAKASIALPVGSMLIVNNLFWLHSRDKFEANPDLRRELLRQRGYFSIPSEY